MVSHRAVLKLSQQTGDIAIPLSDYDWKTIEDTLIRVCRPVFQVSFRSENQTSILYDEVGRARELFSVFIQTCTFAIIILSINNSGSLDHSHPVCSWPP